MITANLSPVRVVNHATGLIAQEGVRLSIATLALFTLPNSLLMHLWFQGLTLPGQPIVRWQLFAWYAGVVLTGAYTGCVIGRQAINTATNRPESPAVLLSGSLTRLRRAFWVYIPLYGTAYAVLRFGHLYAQPLLFLLQFYTPGTTLEGETPGASWRNGWTMTRRHFPGLIVNFGLMSIVTWGFYTTQHPVFDLLLNAMPALVANDVVALYNVIPTTLISIWSTSLYFLARNEIAPPTGTIAQVFE